MTRFLLFFCALALCIIVGCRSGNRAAAEEPIIEGTAAPAAPIINDDEERTERPLLEQTAVNSPSSTKEKQGGKRALLVGIDQYQRCRDLYGCVNDVVRMKAMLMNFYGFTENDILTLSNEEATRDNILESFKTHLIEDAGKDGTILFYFSGHGSQTRDISGDEYDLLDESLVAYDSRAIGGKDVLDDELNVLLKQVAQKTSNCTVILDACHSGDGTRGIDAVKRVRMRIGDSLWYAGQAVKPREKMIGIKDGSLEYTLMTSSSSSEVSYCYEPNNNGVHYGRYTYFLLEAIEHKMPINGTHKDLHDLVYPEVITVAPRQSPTLEGTRTEYVFLGSEKLTHELFIRIEVNSEDNLVINAGKLHGMIESSEFEVYEAGTKSTKSSNPIAKIRLSKVGLTESEFIVLEGSQPTKGCLAHEVLHVFSESSIKVAFLNQATRKGRPISLPKEIKEVEPMDAQVLFKYVDDSLLAFSRFDTLTPIKTYSLNTPSLELRIRPLLSSWETWFYMKQLANDNSKLNISFSLTIAPLEGDSFDYYENHDYVLKPGDLATLRVTNHGRKPLFINVLDLAYDGSVDVLYPSYGREIQLAPETTWTKRVKASLPAEQAHSEDVLKVIVSEKFIDYSSLKTRSGLVPIDPNHDFDWTTEQVLLEVVKPNE